MNWSHDFWKKATSKLWWVWGLSVDQGRGSSMLLFLNSPLPEWTFLSYNQWSFLLPSLITGNKWCRVMGKTTLLHWQECMLSQPLEITGISSKETLGWEVISDPVISCRCCFFSFNYLCRISGGFDRKTLDFSSLQQECPCLFGTRHDLQCKASQCTS